MELSVRRATEDDLDSLAALVVRANATYREWAGDSWAPPGIDHERGRWRERFHDPAAWNAVAVSNGERCGCVSFTDAREGKGAGEAIPELAHLSRLFVDPGSWGQGIGSLLLTRAVEEMHTRGYSRAQLYTAAGNERSRRFYERHGWVAGEETRQWQGLVLIRYSLPLGGA